MKLHYHKKTEFGSKPIFIKNVDVDEALSHLDIYRGSKEYGELAKDEFGAAIELFKDKNRSLLVFFHGKEYEFWIGHIGSVQSWRLNTENIQMYIERYFKTKHEIFFYQVIAENKHIYFSCGGIKGMYVSLMVKLFGKNA
jgi:hypothetical protein